MEKQKTTGKVRGIQEWRADPVGHVFEVVRATSNARISSGQDVDHRRQTEIGAINGAVVREVTKLGSELPVNQTLAALIGVVPADC
jgi:2-dehydropantoate 2-reductase